MSGQLAGVRPWIIQRLSAIYLGGFVAVSALCYCCYGMPDNYQEWRQLLASPGLNLGLLVFAASVLLHAWVGIRDVIVDYLHPVGLRFVVLALFAIGLLGCGLWIARILFNVIGA